MNETKLQIFQNALKDALKATEASLNKTEMLNAFKEVIAQVKKLEAELISMIGTRLSKADTDFNGMVGQMKEMRHAFEQSISETRKANDSTFAQIKQRSLTAMQEMFRKMDVQGQMDKMYAEHDAMMKECEAKMPDTGKMMKEMMDKMPPETPEQTRDKLETLMGKERLSINAIDGLREKLEDMGKIKGQVQYVPSGVSGGGVVKAFDLTSQLNGVLKTFNLPAFWRVISVHSSSTPNAFRPTTDYTTDAGAMTITFTSQIDAASTLNTGQTLLVVYAEP